MVDSTPYSKEIMDLPLGMIAGTSYSQTAVQLELGDLLLLYTDGISESCDESGEQLGLERLLSVARICRLNPPRLPARRCWRPSNVFAGRVPPADDETVVALNGTRGTRMSLQVQVRHAQRPPLLAGGARRHRPAGGGHRLG